MKGQILGLPGNELTGVLVGKDGQRYRFNFTDVRCVEVVAVGDVVDFDAFDGVAKDIFLCAPDTLKMMPKARKRYINKRPLIELWFTLKGRAPRYDYWIRGMLFASIALIVCVIMDARIFGEEAVFTLLGMLLVAWVSLLLAIKRLRDLNKSPWLVLLQFVPVLNVVLFVMLGFFPGTDGANRYGPDPLE